MRRLAIALAAFAAIGIALPVTSPANADTVKKVIIKHRDHDRDRHADRHHRKVVVIKRDRDRHREMARHGKKTVIIKTQGRGDRDHD